MSDFACQAWRRTWFVAMLFIVAACASRPASSSPPPPRFITNPTPTAAPEAGTLHVIGRFTGDDEREMRALLERFTGETGIRVTYEGDGEVAELLRRSVEGGQTPDVILLPKASWLGELASAGAIVPLSPGSVEQVRANFSAAWQNTVTYGGELYGVPFDAALKSLLWHERGGPALPETLDALTGLAARGDIRFTVTGGATWTLTDWFENVLLATAGTEVYDALIAHEVSWTDARVLEAARAYAGLLQPGHILDGAAGIDLPLDEETFARTFSGSSSATAVWPGQGSIVIPYAARAGVEVLPRPFPTGGALVVVGSVAVATNERPETQDLMSYLAQPEAVAGWIEAGGFISPSLNIEPADYPLQANQMEAGYLTEAPALRPDLSDELPPHLNAFLGEQLRAMLKRPEDIEAILGEIEQIAVREQG